MLSVTPILPSVCSLELVEIRLPLIVDAWKMRDCTIKVFCRFTLYRHQRKTLGPARNAPVKLNARYGVSSVACIKFPLKCSQVSRASWRLRV